MSKLKNIIGFKLFESSNFPESFLTDLKYITFELSDIGLKTEFDFIDYYKMDSLSRPSNIIKALSITIKSFFKWEDIKETVLRISELSKQHGYKIDVEIPQDDDYLSLQDFISIYDGQEVYYMSIIIYDKK
jgi:hypothetical protein